MGVGIETFVKYSGGPTQIRVTDIYIYIIYIYIYTVYIYNIYRYLAWQDYSGA